MFVIGNMPVLTKLVLPPNLWRLGGTAGLHNLPALKELRFPRTLARLWRQAVTKLPSLEVLDLGGECLTFDGNAIMSNAPVLRLVGCRNLEELDFGYSDKFEM